jgi:hypothetical protein
MMSDRDAAVQTRNSRIATGVMAFVAVCLGTLLWLMGRHASTQRVFGAGTPDATISITPGRANLAYYLFLLIVAMVPALYFASMAWLPDRMYRGRGGRRRRVAYTALSFASLCGAALMGGYAYEALRSEVRINVKGISYRVGRERAAIDWSDVRLMVLHLEGRSQRLEIGDPRAGLRIELSDLSEPDRLLLVRQIPRIAQLRRVNRAGKGTLVWRRDGSIDIAPGEKAPIQTTPLEESPL